MPEDDGTAELRGAFGEFRSAVVSRLDRLEGKIDALAASLSGVGERLANHEDRIAALEEQGRERREWWRQALQPAIYTLLALSGWAWGLLHPLVGGGSKP